MENIKQAAQISGREDKRRDPNLEVSKPLVSIVAPAYNEEAIIQQNLERLCEYMKGLEQSYRWEILIVNDGSKDNTGPLADAFAANRENIRVFHHKVNRNLGGALQTGFRMSKGDIVVVMDLDLSYGPDHIERLLSAMEASRADIVVASPYMKGGKNTQVPFFRLVLSRVVNYIMKVVSDTDIHTYTSMVRAYNGDFIRDLNLKSNTYSINPEILYKSSILRKRIVEIPAHLDWSFQEKAGAGRTSSIRIFQGILAGLMSGFIFRPYAFFLSIGGIFFLIAMWLIMWIFIHTFNLYSTVEVSGGMINDRFSEAVAAVFRARPHAFIVGGVTLIVALQFLGIGFLSLQSKRYFDELFHINSSQISKWKRLQER